MLKRLKEQHITILVSTPYMDEATLCDRIALMQQGSILAIDTPDAIIESYPDILYAIRAGKMPALLKVLGANNAVATSYAFGEYAHATFKEPVHQEQDIVSLLQHAGMDDVEVKRIRPTIEDCFIKLLHA
jgi:ABC-type multidrug transport system ATPase subunit